ncbi:MAG: radical SAM/SPASM domain-containing protein [Planctomycetaceae bacterium]|nr:radical SAM/SPASM domain-containing protein [Planctomycetaceae bacterium]
MGNPGLTQQNMLHSQYTPADFRINPLMFYYEVTTACDLVCKHCRASAQEAAHPGQLTTEQSKALIDQVATFPRKPNLVLTGGDPLKRSDIFDLIRHAVAAGLQVALTPSATPLATKEALQKAKDAGVRILGISLDGPDAKTHDAFRGWEGSFNRTMRMLIDARKLGLGVQINTTITQRNFHLIEEMATLLSTQGIAMWSVFFLIPVGRGIDEERISPEQYEEAFERLWIQAGRQPYGIKTTEAPHYRRFVMQRHGDPLAEPTVGQVSTLPKHSGNERQARSLPHGSRDRNHRTPLGVRDGNGIMFVSHTGKILPAGFLPLVCESFPNDSVVDIYQHHPTFLALRDPDQFTDDCGICEYRYICGGSRSRAYAVTGDPLAGEPDCVYQPGQIPTIQLEPVAQ